MYPKDQNGQITGSSESINSIDQSLYELNRPFLRINQSLASNMQSTVDIKTDYKSTSKRINQSLASNMQSTVNIKTDYKSTTKSNFKI